MTDRLAVRLSWCFFIVVAAAGSLSAATFTASQSGNWSSASTWGGAGVPGAGDTATVGSSIAVTVDVAVTIANLTLNSGTINGSQALTVTTAMSWNGGTMSGSGSTVIPSGSVLTVGGAGFLDARALSIAGTANFTGGNYFYMQNGATLTNSGVIDFQGDGGGLFLNGAVGAISITSSGTIKKSAGTGTSYVQLPLTAQSGAQVLAQSGTLQVYGVTSSGATFDSSATLLFASGDTRTFDAASTISGSGTVNFNAGTNTVSGTYNVTGATVNNATTTIASPAAVGDVTVNSGTLTLNGASTLNVHTITITSGTLNGSAPINLTGTSMTWSGGTIGGTGAFTIPAVCTLTVNGVFLDGRAFTNNGTIILTTGYMYLQDNAVLTNNNVISYQGDANIYVNGTVGSTSIVNNGTIQKVAGTVGSNLDVPLTAQSGSQLNVGTGILYLHNVAATGAAFSVSAGATLYFYYTATATFDAASSISGAGNVQWGNGANSVAGNYNVTGTTLQSGGTGTALSNIGGIGNVSVSSGTLTLNSGSTLTIPTLTMSGGALAGTAPIAVSAASMTWSGGTIGGTGAFSIPNGTTVTVNAVILDSRAFSNAGSIVMTTGYFYLQNNAVLTNGGTIDYQGDANIYVNGTVGSCAIVNNGTIKKSAGTNGSNLDVPLTANSGSQLLVQSGPLYMHNVTSSGAAFNVSSGATLYFYYTTTATFDAASTISGAGSVQFGAGTETVAGAYSISGFTKISGGAATLSNITSTGSILVGGGTLTLNSGSALSVPTLTMQGGILNGTAPINLTSASMSWSGGTLGGSGALSIPNGTTVTVSGSIFLDTKTATNGGILQITGGTLYLQNNAVLTNNGTIDLAGDTNILLNSVAGSTVVNNNGTIKKSAGASGSSLQVALAAASGSQLLVQSSILYIGNVTSSGATFTVSANCTLYFYYTSASSFDAASTINGAGTVNFGVGTNGVSGSYNVTGTTRSSGGTTTLANIASLGDLIPSGGTLTLNGASAISIPTLQMQGGTLAGTAPLSITGASMTWTSGTVGGTGALSIPNGTTITVNGAAFLDARPISNAGTINLQNGSYFYFQNNAVLTNSGTIDLLADGHLYLNGVAGGNAIVNGGTLRKSGGTSGSSVSVPLILQSGGVFQVNSSIVYFGNVASSGGSITVASGTTAILYYTTTATFDSASTVSGAGTLQVQAGTTTFTGTLSSNVLVNGGTLTLSSAATQSIPALTMTGGTLNGSANINLTGASMNWNGGTISGTGTLTIPSGTTISIAGVPFIDGRPITNGGTIQVTSSYYFYLENNAVLTNNGTIDFLGDGNAYLNGAAGTTAVVNNGTIRKSAGTASSFTAPLTANAGSQFLVQAGTFYMGNITSNGGAFSISSGAVLMFYYGNATFDAASTISGAGTLTAQGGTNAIAGTLSTALNLVGGTLSVNSAAAQTIPTLTMAGGTLGGSATLNVTAAAMTWSGGTVGGSGTLSIPAGTIVTIAGYLYFDNRQITNAGQINFTSTYYVYMQNNAVLSNSGTVDFQGSDNAVYLNSTVGSTAINNSGTFRKSGGGTNSYVTVPINAASGSQFQVQNGLVYLGTIASTGGTFSISSGATMALYYGNATFDSASTISGSGTFSVQNNTHAFAGTISAKTILTGGTFAVNSASAQSLPSLTMNGGTLSGSGNVNVTGASTWSNGTFSGSGTLTVSAAAAVTSSGFVVVDGKPIVNNGTITISGIVTNYMENGAALTNNGTMTFDSDGSILFNGGAACSIANNGTFAKDGGSGTSSVSVAFTNAAGGTVRAARSTLWFSNGYTQAGTLYFPISGASLFGRVQVSGNLALGGTLTATTISYTPSNGTAFQVLTFGSSSGAFANKNLDYSAGTFTETYAPTTLTLTAGPPSLTVTAVSPSRGGINGGTVVSVSGTNFASGATVTFGGTAATNVVFNNSTSLTATTPAHAAGLADVTVTNPSTQAATLQSGYTYTGLVSHYTFDVAGTPGKDVVSGYDATNVTGVSQTAGKVGNGGTFSSGYMDLPAAANLEVRSGDFTLSAFVKSSATTNANWFTKAAAGPSQQYGLGTSGSTKALFSFDGGSGGSVTSTSNIFDGNWHHVAGIKRGNAIEIWVDGRLEASGAVSGSADSGTFSIGRDGPNCCDTFNGQIDEARIYNYALTSSEVIADALATDLVIVKTAPPSATAGQGLNYAITVTNNGPISATNVVVTDALPAGTSFVNANASQGTCSGSSTVTCALGTIANGGSASVSISATATATGTITNTASVSATEPDPTPGDDSSSASTAVSALTCAAPTISANGPTTFCPGGSVTLIANASSPTSYQWFLNNAAIASATGSTYTATAAGSYTVRVGYASSCTATSSPATVTINTPPSAVISAPASACPNANVTASVPVSSGATYAWTATNAVITGGQAGDVVNFTPNGAGNVALTVNITDANGCSATGNATVNVTNFVPTVTASGPTSFCAGGSVTLTAQSGTSYLWSTGAHTQSITVSTSGNYSVTVSNGSCSGSSNPVTVTVGQPPNAQITAGGPTTFCAPGSVTLTASPAGGTYAWSNGATTQSITVFGSGSFSVTVTANGCSATSAATTVTVNPAPIVSITGPSTFCAGTPITLDAGPGFSSYHWSNGATTQTITDSPSSTTTYSVTVTNAQNCSATASKTVTLGGSPSPVITAAAAVCANSANDSASVGAVAGATYAWTIANGAITSGQGTNAIQYTAGATGSVTLGVTVNGGSCSGSSSKSVPIQAPPAVAISGPSSTCPNVSFTLDAGAGYAAYAWSTGATTRTITVSQTATTTYSVNVTTSAGCSGGATQTVSMASSGTVTITAPASVVAGSPNHPASVPAGPAGTTYAWSITNGAITAGQGTNAVTFTAGPSGTITISVSTNNGGCVSTGSASVAVTTLADLSIAINAPSSVNAGAPLTYVLNVANAGPTTAQNVNVSNTLPSGVAFGSASGTGWSCALSGNVVNCNAAAVPVGNATPITITGAAPATAGNITDSATVSSSTPESNLGNNAVSVTTSVSVPSPQCPTAPPSLLAPANNAAAVPNPVAFSWSAVPNATAYDLFVNGAVAASTASTSASIGLPAGPATWYVVARFTSCQPLFSETRAFTVAAATNCAHAAPQLIAATPSGNNVTFQWSAVPEAIGYRLWIAIDGGAAQDAGTTGGALSLTIPVNGTSVSWFVEALFNGCPSTTSGAAAFTLPRPDPCAGHGAATLVAPANNATSTSSAISFQWTAAAGASGYRLFASIAGAPFAALGTTTDTTLPATLTTGSVEWYVQTLFDGCPSLDSAHFTFTIPKAQNCPPGGAAPQSPVNATLDHSPVTFSWSAAPNAIGYELWLSLDHAAPALLGTTTGATTLQHDVAAGALEWYVVTRYNGCPSVESAHASFTFAPPANCPSGTSILTVPGDTTSVTGPVDFRWSAVPGATQYEVFAARNGNAPASLGTTSALHLDAQQLQPGAWTWSVAASFGGACSNTQSAPGVFTVLAPPPPCAPPAIPTVRAGQTASSNVVYAIRWNSIGNAGFYEVQQSTSPDFSSADTDAVYGTEKSYQHVNNTAAPLFFYYRVRSVGSCDATVKSLFSPVLAVAVLPTQQATSGATPADDPQNVSYTLDIPTQPGLPFSATANEPWVTVTPSSGTTTGNTLTLTVTANTTGLPAGTSTAAISVLFAAPSRIGANSTSTSTTVNVNLVQPISPGSKNTPPPDALIIPAVAHAGGINSNFQSDVRITNTAPQTQKYQLTFTPDDGTAKSTTVSIDPGKTLALDDLLATWFGNGTSAIGTLEIRPMATSSTATSPSATPSVTTYASSRTYNVTANGTFGQYIPAIPFAQFIGKNGLISLQQVASSSAFRTNLGLLEASGDPATVLVSVFGNDGSKLAEFTQALAGGQHLQMNGVLATKGLTNLADGRIEVKLTSAGGKVTAYASVLDNQTNDPLLVTPVSISTTGAPKYVLPGIADLDNGVASWRSDVRIYNPGAASVNATATFYPLGGGDPLSKQLTIGPNQVQQIDAALQTLFGLTNAGGALHITTENNAPLVATARTYNQTGSGTFGQFIPAVTPNDAVGKGGRALQILQVEESDRFRSNIGVTEVTGKPAKVEITAIPPDSKFAVTGTFDFGPNEYRQYSSLLKSLGLDTAYNTRVTVRVIDGDGKVSAYASVVDMQTQDPNYVQAQ